MTQEHNKSRMSVSDALAKVLKDMRALSPAALRAELDAHKDGPVAAAMREAQQVLGSPFIIAKLAEMTADTAVIMSDADLDWLIDNGLHPADMVSIPNPQRVGVLDAYLVGYATCPVMRAARSRQDAVTSATRARARLSQEGSWDEVVKARTARGWYWPSGSTTPGETLCAGHYIVHGPDYHRYDGDEASEPGNVQCVVLAKGTGQGMAWRYVQTVSDARAWIESEAAKLGHIVD